jgi:peptide/nickel transport system permease protein
VTSYLSRRLVQAVVVVWGAFTLSFIVLFSIPGDPILTMVAGGGEVSSATPEEIDALRAEYGYDRPLYQQYFSQLAGVVTGDLGRSIRSGEQVTTTIANALPATATLAVVALLLALLLGVGIALLATYTRTQWLRQVLLSLPAVGISLPTFWVGLMLVQLLSFTWHVFPALGNEGVQSLVLPAITLALPAAAMISQVLAKSMNDTLSEPYVETALAKGVSRARIHFRHAFRNATIAPMTVLGLVVGHMLAGSVVVETVFSRTGIGRITVIAVTNKDIPVVQGLVVFGAVVFVVVSLLVDVVYPLVDPRITTARTAG